MYIYIKLCFRLILSLVQMLLISQVVYASSACQKSLKGSRKAHSITRVSYLPIYAPRSHRDSRHPRGLVLNRKNGLYEPKPVEIRMVASKSKMLLGSSEWKTEYMKSHLAKELVMADLGYDFDLKHETLYGVNYRETEKAREFVLSKYKGVKKTREVFNEDFISSLKKQDSMRDEYYLAVWFVENSIGEVLASWSLYFHNDMGPFAFYELTRLAVERGSDFSIKELLPYISEHLSIKNVMGGINGMNTSLITIQTDKVGARLYKKFGAEVVDENGMVSVLQTPIYEFLEMHNEPALVDATHIPVLSGALDDGTILIR